MDLFKDDIADNEETKTLPINTREKIDDDEDDDIESAKEPVAVANTDQIRSIVYDDPALSESRADMLRRCSSILDNEINEFSPSMIPSYYGFASNEKIPPAADPSIFPNHGWAGVMRRSGLYNHSAADEYTISVPSLKETILNFSYYRSARIELTPTADPDIYPNYGGRITSASCHDQPFQSTAGLSMS